jgi:hypothetical protein
MLAITDFIGHETRHLRPSESWRIPGGPSGHTLNRGMVGAWLFGRNTRYSNDGNLIRDLSGFNNHLKPSAMGTALTVEGDLDAVSKVEGYSLRGVPTTLNAEKMFLTSVGGTHSLALTRTHSMTVGFRLFYTDLFANVNDFPRILDKSSGANAAGGYAIWFDSTGGGGNALILGMDGSQFILPPSGVYIAEWRTYFVVVNPPSLAGVSQLYMGAEGKRDGIELISQASANTTFSTATTDFTVANASTINRPFEGRMPWLYVWDRALTLDEMNTCARAPYAMFQAPKNWLLFNRRIDIEPPSLVDPDGFGVAAVTVEQNLSATGYTNPNSFGNATVTAGTTLTASSYLNDNFFGPVSLSLSLDTISYNNPNFFGLSNVNSGLTLFASGYSDADEFGTATLATFHFYGFYGPAHLIGD